MKKFTLAFCGLLISIFSYASHVNSAEIRYEYTGTGNVYRVFIKEAYPCGSFGSLSTAIIKFSSSCSSTFTRTLPQLGNDTFQTFCPTYPNSCSNPSSFPAFVSTIFSDTVTLAPCSNWKISYDVGSRATSDNLLNAQSQDLYVEALLNNSTAPNSSAYIANPPYHILATNSNNTIPIKTIDIENDSLVYEWYQPQGVNGAPINYSSNNYSLYYPTSAPVSINVVNQLMYINGGNIGRYSLGLRIKDYRNGVFVGSSARDFTVTSYNIPAVSVPLPTSPMQYNTCPGVGNNITLNFADSTTTDSVYMEVTPPIIPGFTFTVNNSPGIGVGSTNISWTTPASLNPATLPYFFINVKVRDNTCPGSAMAEYAVIVRVHQCNTDTVWAGDANSDYTVNNYDPLAVAVAYGKTGPLRPSASTIWQAQYCPNWVDTFVNGINMKHADCNGDGVVDTSDLSAINLNFGDVHVKPGGAYAKINGVPDLFFDVSGINFYPGATVSVPIKLGTIANTMSNFYGLASNISVGGILLTSPMTITYPTSWMGNASNTLHFAHFSAGNNNQVNWAYSRIDHQNVSGQGIIAMLNFTIPANAAVGQQISFSFNNSKVIDNNMVENTSFNEDDTVASIKPLSVNNIDQTINNAFVVPNPSRGEANLQLSINQNSNLEIVITDIVGKVVSTTSINVAKGSQTILLPSNLNSGMYLIKIADEHSTLKTVKWIKE